ncbi:MAG: MBL fold metallo-hydrolase [Bradymonadia bacterium]
MLRTLLTACLMLTFALPAAQAETGLFRYTSPAAGFDTHTWYYVTPDQVVVFDAQFTPALAQSVIKDIQARTKVPISHVVVTHPNPDKFNGVGPFQALGAKVVASDATAKAIPGVHAYKKYYFVQMAKMFTEATYPAEARVDITFTGAHTLTLKNGERIELKTLKHPGVSSTQTVAWIPAKKALVVGDLVHHKAHAWLEGGIVDGAPRPDLSKWSKALDELKAWPDATVYGGRGQTAPVAQAVSAQQRYLDAMGALVKGYVAQHGLTQAALKGEQAAAHHKALAEQAAKTFPEYALPYMVQYGVYGLLGAEVSAAQRGAVR